jgi:hypothetical protein
LVLFSCYIMPTQSTGSITIEVPSVSPRTVSNGSGTSVGETIRVYLYTYAVRGDDAHYSLYKFPGGGSYKDVLNTSAQTEKISLDNIPTGQWKVLIATGSPSSDGFLAVRYSGSSSVFDLVPGTVNSVALKLTPTPFSINPSLVGSNVVGVRTLGGTLYAATSDTLYAGSATNQSALAVSGSLTRDNNSSALTAGGNTIESLSNGYLYPATPALFVNTSGKGIIPYDGINAPVTGFSSNLTPKTGILSGLLSGAFTVPNAIPPGLVIFYRRDGGLGGAYLAAAGTPPAAGWIDFSTSGIVSGQPVYSFVMNNDFAYVATKLGAFRLQDTSFKTTQSTDILNLGKAFSAGKDLIIQSLAVDTAKGLLYMGTSNGVYTAPLQESNSITPIGTPTLLAWTKGDSFTKLSINPSGDIAMLSEYNLYVVDTTGNNRAYPFFSGLPGELTSMAWGGTGDKTLYVAGDKGLVAITVIN